MFELDHEHYMRRAIALTSRVPELPFASVIVHRERGEITAVGWNKSAINPTWHGETDALNNLFSSSREVDGSKLVLYTTAEPCPMCMAAILWSGISLVVYGTSIPQLKESGWRQIDVRAEQVLDRSPGWPCALVGGVLKAACDSLFAAGPPQGPPRHPDRTE